ncbi:hypothetical protein AB0912_15385 [Streptomyces sp. NPDC007084]|uniref:hypothetical protein n=1 Tax=Streptomyces sp. NPDC007084 TaxID=3154313 RepID=UPI0034514A5B
MFGLTTTRHHRAVTTELRAQLAQAYLSAELDRRRFERSRAIERKNYRDRLDRMIKAVAHTRRDLTGANGTIGRLAKQIVDQPRPERIGSRG